MLDPSHMIDDIFCWNLRLAMSNKISRDLISEYLLQAVKQVQGKIRSKRECLETISATVIVLFD